MSPYNWLTPYLSANYSLVTSLSVASESINDSLLKATAASLSRPLIYFISGPYYSSIRRQRITLSVVRLSNVEFLWSVYTVIRCHKIIVRNSFRVSTKKLTVIFLLSYHLFVQGIICVNKKRWVSHFDYLFPQAAYC